MLRSLPGNAQISCLVPLTLRIQFCLYVVDLQWVLVRERCKAALLFSRNWIIKCSDGTIACIRGSLGAAARPPLPLCSTATQYYIQHNPGSRQRLRHDEFRPSFHASHFFALLFWTGSCSMFHAEALGPFSTSDPHEYFFLCSVHSLTRDGKFRLLVPIKTILLESPCGLSGITAIRHVSKTQPAEGLL